MANPPILVGSDRGVGSIFFLQEGNGQRHPHASHRRINNAGPVMERGQKYILYQYMTCDGVLHSGRCTATSSASPVREGLPGLLYLSGPTEFTFNLMLSHRLQPKYRQWKGSDDEIKVVSRLESVSLWTKDRLGRGA